MKCFNSVNKYEDIIDRPHHVSPNKGQMPIGDRAAQFSPFAALTGYDDAVKETARLTEEWIELDENSKVILNRRLQELKAHIKEQPEIIVTYFLPDARKKGGSYLTITGKVKKINEYERLIIFTDGSFIPIDRIYDITVLLP